MSDPAPTATATQTQPEDNGTTFTSHELLYLLALNDTEAAAVTRERLRLGEPAEEGTRLYAAGAATLSIRGLLRQEGEDLIPAQEVQALAAMLTECEHWVEIGLLGELSAEGAVMVSAGPIAVVLMAKDLGKFTAVALEHSNLVTPVAIQIVRTFLTQNQPGAASVHVTNQHGTQQGVLHRTDTGAWLHTTGDVDDDGNIAWHDIDDGDVDQLVGDLTAKPDDDTESPGEHAEQSGRDPDVAAADGDKEP